MPLRVHLPRDSGLAAATAGATHSLAEMLRMELAARCMSWRDLGKLVGKSHSTLGNYLRGAREFPPELLANILAVLRNLGPFCVPGLEHTAVIPTLDALPEYPNLEITPHGFPMPYGLAGIDTLWVNFDIPEDRQQEVHEHLRAVHQELRVRRGMRGGDEAVFALSPWEPVGAERKSTAPIVSHRKVGRSPKDWMRVQFSNLRLDQAQAYFRLDRVIRNGDPLVAVRLKRIDFCVDYPVDPRWLVFSRPRARTYEWMTSFAGVHGIGIGRRGGPGLYLRCYNAAVVHQLPGPLTRIEIEWTPERGLTWADFAQDFQNPFDRVWVGTLTAPDLTSREILYLQQSRVSGLPAYRKTLERSDRLVLDSAIEKASTAPRIRPHQDFHAKWVYIKEQVRHVLGCP